MGPLPEALQARVVSLTPDTLLSLSKALLDFAEQGELVAWLDQHLGSDGG